MILPPPSVIDFFPDYRSTQIAWQGLTPVAAWAVADLKPRRIVELGSYRGDSFFAFLQAAAGVAAVQELVAVDSWEGDQHTGAFTESVHHQFHAELAARNDPRARSVRSLFSDAVAGFEDGSIDLLHIDGAHDYASVRADYLGWLPKMARDGVILFHDTLVKTDDFGVWQLWDEITAAHPGRTFNIGHSNGLGILCLGKGKAGDFRKLGALAAVEAAILREALRLTGQSVTDQTAFEFDLIRRCGGTVPDDHVFARGASRDSLARLRLIDGAASVGRIDTQIDARIDRLVSEQSGDLFAAMKPFVQDGAASLRAEVLDQLEKAVRSVEADTSGRIEARIERLVSGQAGDLFAAMKPFVEDGAASLRAEVLDQLEKAVRSVEADTNGMVEARIERLVGEQAGDLFAAMKPFVETVNAALRTGILAEAQSDSRSLTDALALRIQTLVADLDALAALARIKNAAQDDAIIGVGAKVEAHEAAVQELSHYLRQVFTHPLFRS